MKLSIQMWTLVVSFDSVRQSTQDEQITDLCHNCLPRMDNLFESAPPPCVHL